MSGQRNLGDALDRLAGALEAQERRERERLEHERQTADYSRIGHRSEPRVLQFIDYARAVPGLLARFDREIPSEFWSLDGSTAIISCPCGETPQPEAGATETCECGRAYLFTGRIVRVAFSPAKTSADPIA